MNQNPGTDGFTSPSSEGCGIELSKLQELPSCRQQSQPDPLHALRFVWTLSAMLFVSCTNDCRNDII